MYNIIFINIITFYCTYIYPYVELIYNIYNNAYKLIIYDYIEPYNINKEWKCLVILNNNIYYEFYDDNIIPYKNNNSLLYIQKLQNGYYLYNNELTFNKLEKQNELTFNKLEEIKYERSSIFFLSITLIQNNINFNIHLKKNEYIVGNKLFSKQHIVRYIKYEVWWNWIRFNIKKSYKISIIDTKMNIIEINDNQLILLDKKHINICLSK